MINTTWIKDLERKEFKKFCLINGNLICFISLPEN